MNNDKKLFDLVLPLGMPHKIIMETVDKFNLEVVTQKVVPKTIDIDKENLLALRGKLEDINNAHDYIYQKLSENSEEEICEKLCVQYGTVSPTKR